MAHDSSVSTRTRKKTAPGAGAPIAVIRTGEGQPTLQLNTTANYNWIYNDDGTLADRDVTIWRPQPSDASYFIIGDYAQGNYSPAVGASLIVRPINDDPANPLIKAPVDFSLVWNNHGAWGGYWGSIWYPVPPDGYITIGFVASSDYDKPKLTNFACLRRDLCELTDGGEGIWSDEGSGANMNVTLFSIVGVPNAFVGQGNYAPFEGTAYKLKNF